jgi:hypothetical protein
MGNGGALSIYRMRSRLQPLNPNTRIPLNGDQALTSDEANSECFRQQARWAVCCRTSLYENTRIASHAPLASGG